MKYLASFFTHYGAMSFKKYCTKNDISAKMMPVPRELSSSCGVCIQFETSSAPEIAKHEDMEHCYIVGENGSYILSEG